MISRQPLLGSAPLSSRAETVSGFARFTEQWLGVARPKQYCAFVGTRSMLDHTLDRAAQWCEPSRIVTVVADSHREFLASRRPRRSDGLFVVQPGNRGTATGLLLGLSYIPRDTPNPTVAILPSDHFVYPEWRFMRALRTAATAVESMPDRLILLGAPADGLELDYGWVSPGDAVGPSVNGQQVRAVESFLEKPRPVQARAARSAGGLWNTMVLWRRRTHSGASYESV